jgi:hypothetical protein
MKPDVNLLITFIIFSAYSNDVFIGVDYSETMNKIC